MTGVKLGIKRDNNNDDDILEEISLDTSWLDSNTDNDSIEIIDDMKVPDNLEVKMPSKTIDGDRDRFVYNGDENDNMKEEYFPDIAFEQQDEEEVVEDKIEKKSPNKLLIAAISVAVLIVIIVAVLIITKII